jgi:hypothetical protein
MKIDIGYKEGVLLRRIVMQNIPNFAFTETIISSNNTLLDNDHIEKRIENIPVRGVYFTIHKFKKFVDDNIDFIVHNDTSKTLQNIPILRMTCSKKYDNSNDLFLQPVTTKDCRFFLDDKEIKNPYKEKNFKIVDLKFNTNKIEQIEFVSETTINIPFLSSIYSIAENPVWNPNMDSDHQIFEFNARDPDITPENILLYAKYIIKKKMEALIEAVHDQSHKGIIEFNNDKYTMPCFISYCLNKHKDIQQSTHFVENMLDTKGFTMFSIQGKKEKK